MNRNVDTLYPATPLQHGMLHHSQREPRAGLYVEQFSCRLEGALDVARLRAAWSETVQRHDVLKTLFIRLHDAQPVQVVRRQVELPFEHQDWSALDAAAQQARFEHWLVNDRVRGFDPAAAPLMRLFIADLGRTQHRLLWTYHHAILDGWSMPILLQEVFARYAGEPVPPPGRDFRHYVAWLREQDPETARAHWRNALDGYREPLRLAPAPHHPAADAASPPADVVRRAHERATLPAEWVAQAQAYCRRHKLTLNTLCQGAWAMLLALHADRDDVVHGFVVSGRQAPVPGVDRMLGLFINTVPARVRIDPAAPLADWLRRLQAEGAQHERHAHLALAEIVRCAPLPPAAALFDTLYVFENYPGQAAFAEMGARAGLQIDELRALEETNFALALIVLPGATLRLELVHDPAALAPRQPAAMLEQYVSLLQAMVAADDVRAGAFGLRAAPVPEHAMPAEPATLIAQVRAQAARNPSRCAWRAEGKVVDFSTLDAAIDQGRRRWAALGYRRGDGALLCAPAEDAMSTYVMLLSGLAEGIDCVVPPPHADLDALLAAGPTVFGPLALRGCVGARAGTLRTGLRRDRFDGPPSPEACPPASLAGACWTLELDAEGRWTLLRHTHRALAQWVAGALRQGGGEGEGGASAGERGATGDDWPRPVPLLGAATAPRALWSVLRAWVQGRAVWVLPGDETAWTQLATTRWHHIALDDAWTRRVGHDGRIPAPIDTAGWQIDGLLCTPAALRRLREASPHARIERELRWPPSSLPHASHTVDAGDDALSLGTPTAGGRLVVLDRQGRPAAEHAIGRLVIEGPTVPAGAWCDGEALADLGDDGRLHTGVAAWRRGACCHAHWPDAAAASRPDAAVVALERSFDGDARLHELAAVPRLDARGAWELALFHVPAAGAEETLAATLHERGVSLGLPRVVPVALQRLPRRARGVDRAALAQGAYVAAPRGVVKAPRDDLEAGLHAVWCAVLERERVGVDDDFFALGGQSLLAAILLYRIEERFGRSVGMDTLLARPTIEGLAAALREPAGEPVRADDANVSAALARDAALAPDIVPEAPARAPATVLLTGATGFLGVQLLAELLAATPWRVVCLVRAQDDAAAHARVIEALRQSGEWRPWQTDRIEAVAGELEAPRFGWSDDRFDALAQRVDAVYHNAALVNFVYPYAALKAANVQATQEVLRLACRHHAKPVHHVSTVGVLDRLAPVLDETLLVPLHERLMGGYEQSKWVAEQLVARAAQRGLPVALYRPSRVVGHSRTGRSNIDDLFGRLVRGIVDLGKAPVNTGFDNMLPVDIVAAAIVEASRHRGVFGQAVHVVHPEGHAMDRVIEQLEHEGHQFEALSYGDWLAQLTAHVRVHAEHPLTMLVPVLRKLDPQADPSLARRMPFACVNLAQFAPHAFARASAPVEPWLSRQFAHLRAAGALPVPPRCQTRGAKVL